MKLDTINISTISTFPPTHCGIATYASDLTDTIKTYFPEFTIHKLRLLFHSEDTAYQPGNIINSEEEHFHRAIDRINFGDTHIVDLQHEFKIFGGKVGENISFLLNGITKPIITTLHTVMPELNEQRAKIFSEVLMRSDLFFVFSTRAKEILIDIYKVTPSKIGVIPHGVPTIEKRHNVKLKSLKEPVVFISAGHMRGSKGYELALEAFSLLREKLTDFKYFILGADHPENSTSKSYRESLEAVVARLGFNDNVIFVDSYLKREKMIEYFQSADIGLVPYTAQEQSSSGILALMIASGLPIISTPFQFAKSIINESSGILTESFSVNDLAKSITDMIEETQRWEEIGEYNYHLGQMWNWKCVSEVYIQRYKNLFTEYYSIPSSAKE